MKILIVAATQFEVVPLHLHLEEQFRQSPGGHFQKEGLSVSVLITGVGLMLSGFALGKALASNKFDLAINAGIAGSFRSRYRIGEVVQVISECLGDIGVEEADGSFTDAHTLGLIEKDQPPFQDGILLNEQPASFGFLPKVRGLSVNKVHGHEPGITRIREQYQADVESMEGAAFFYACLVQQQPFLEIRAISNYIESRNKENWNIPLAINNLNEVLIEMLEVFSGSK